MFVWFFFWVGGVGGGNTAGLRMLTLLLVGAAKKNLVKLIKFPAGFLHCQRKNAIFLSPLWVRLVIGLLKHEAITAPPQVQLPVPLICSST